jgi:hypothetical protein
MKRNLLLSLTFLTIPLSSVFAQTEDINCAPENSIQQFSSEILGQLAPLKECPSEDDLILKKVTAEYKQYYGGLSQVSQVIKGFSLKGSAKELKLATEMLGAKPPKDWKTAATGCATIQCAFEKLFNSKEAAMQVFNIHAKSGYNLSLDQTINQNKADQHWSAKEVREFDAAITKLPKELRHLSHVGGIDRQGDGLRGHGHEANVAAYASPYVANYKNAELVVYDSGLTGKTTGKSPYDTTSWPQEVLIHELCHHHDFKGLYNSNFSGMTSEQKNAGFKNLSGWKEQTGKKGEAIWVYTKNDSFVSWYAATSPAEDYAETCMNYVLHPEVLEKKAPAKYAYMKKQTFKGLEFKDKIWNKEQKLNWPKLNDLLADEAGCDTALVECMKDLKYEYGSFSYPTSKSGSMTMYSSGSAQTHIKNSSCFKNYKSDRAKKLEEVLAEEADYCQQGGQRVIKNNSSKICQNAEALLGETLEEAAKVDVKQSIALCEAANDFTVDCVVSKVPDVLEVPKAFLPSVKVIIQSKIPNRMSAMGNKLETIKTSEWLKSCLGAVSNISSFTSIDSKSGVAEKIFSYQSSSEAYSSGYLGRFVYEDSPTKDINLGCAKNMLSTFEDNGFKVPESGNPINLIKKPFSDEFKSFETEVLANISSATSKCLLKKCRVTKVSELLSEWEKKSPEKRSGVIEEDFVLELIEKSKGY